MEYLYFIFFKWNVITIPCLAYDPNAAVDNSIEVQSYGYTKTLVELLGETNGEVNGKIISKGTNKGKALLTTLSEMIP